MKKIKKKICIGTGWYADHEGHSNPKRSKRTLQADWLSRYWRPYIERYIIPDEYVLYLSNCEIWPEFSSDDIKRFRIIEGSVPGKRRGDNHDYNCGLMMGAQYALCNGMDFLYIEQDCMVKGLDKAIAWAQDKKLVYGFGEMCCYSRGWAAQSLVWVKNDPLNPNKDFLPEFIARMNLNRVHERKGTPVTEVIFHDLFQDVAEYWPFGYDRKRPADFSLDKEVFYIQQVSDKEIDFLMNLQMTKDKSMSF